MPPPQVFVGLAGLVQAIPVADADVQPAGGQPVHDLGGSVDQVPVPDGVDAEVAAAVMLQGLTASSTRTTSLT